MHAFLLAMGSLWKREIVRFLRQRNRVIGALGTPLVFWLVIGSGIGTSFRPGSLPEQMHYLEYFYPGTILLVVLFTAIFSTISIIEDRREGFLQGVLVSPASSLAIVLGKVLGGATLAVGQGLLLYALAPLLGLHVSLQQFFELAGVLIVVSMALTALGYVMAWPMSSTHGYHAMMNLFLMPMWIVSGALFTPESASGWMRLLMKINPLSYGLAAMRHAIYKGDAVWIHQLPSAFFSNIVMIVFTLFLLFFAARLTQKTCRT